MNSKTPITVPDTVYGAGWDGSLEVPTKNAVYDKIQTLSGGSGMTFTNVTGTTQSMAISNGYIANNAGLVTMTLPATAAVGSIVRVVGAGAGGWRISQNAGQTIYFGSVNTTAGTGGYVASSHRRDSIELICTATDTDWTVMDSQGNITYV